MRLGGSLTWWCVLRLIDVGGDGLGALEGGIDGLLKRALVEGGEVFVVVVIIITQQGVVGCAVDRE